MPEPPRLTATDVGVLARRVLDTPWPPYALATAILTAPPRQWPGLMASGDSAATAVPEFVATLSDDERRMLRDLIDAEVARREAGGDGAPQHDDLIVAYQPDRAIPEVG